MKDEVEEFLRRAAARRAQAEARRREQAQQPARPMPQRPAPISRAPLQPVAEDIVEIIDAEEADTTSRFSSNVSQHLSGTTEIARHAARLGAEVDQADDKLQARLSRTFDHKLGQLKDTTTAAPTPQAKAAADSSSSLANITRLLANPQSIRNAIILSEILNRPEDRW
jgi:hypothetical protein